MSTVAQRGVCARVGGPHTKVCQWADFPSGVSCCRVACGPMRGRPARIEKDSGGKRKVIFVEFPADVHADVFVVAGALKMTASAFVRKAVRRALYEARKEPLAA